MACGEFELIQRYFTDRQRHRRDVIKSIGDDCALVKPVNDQLLAISTDTLVCGTHFFEDIPAHALGYKALAVNLSDLAAMGASPNWVSLALTLPEIDEAWVSDFSDGFFKAADYYEIDLIGGDMSKGPLSITLTVQGQVGTQQQLLRSNAKVGDWICVTGNLGDSALALEHLYNRINLSDNDRDALLKKHYYPTPRLLAGQALRNIASAAIDISDGLSSDLAHIAHQSGCQAVVDIDALPMSQELISNTTAEQAQRFALAGGEDYELCFTVAPENFKAIETALKAINTPFVCVGQMQTGEGVVFQRNNEAVIIDFKGFEHF